jgi:hypothetical protein
MRAITSFTRTSHALRATCVAVTALLGLSLVAVVEQELTAPAPSAVVADSPITGDPDEEWDSRG